LSLWLAGPRGGSITLILAGIAISSFAGALTALALSLSPNPFAVMEITFWMMGSLADRSMTHVALAVPFILAGAALLLPLGRGLDALTLGEDAAAALGIRLSALRLRLVGGVALAVGAATAVAGVVGFVGLVVPHLLRPFVGGRPGALLPAAALGGAAMVLAADVAVRLILPRGDLKLGVLTALVGAPLFLHLIWKTRGQLG
jgi:iron complex transport system permease protein